MGHTCCRTYPSTSGKWFPHQSVIDSGRWCTFPRLDRLSKPPLGSEFRWVRNEVRVILQRVHVKSDKCIFWNGIAVDFDVLDRALEGSDRPNGWTDAVAFTKECIQVLEAIRFAS